MRYMQVSLFFVLVVAPFLGQQQEATPYFAIHLVADCGSAEKIFLKDQRRDKQYCIEPAAIITDRDISSATAENHDRPSLVLTLGAEGSERLHEATVTRVGEGSLAVLINGELVGVSKIYEPLRDDVDLILGTTDEVTLWAGVLQSKAHPSVQVRLVIACPPGGFQALTIEGTSERFCLSQSTVVDERDVSTAAIARTDQGRIGLTLQLKKSSVPKVRDASEKLVGERVGFIVNNRLMMVSNVTSPFSSPVTVYGNFTESQLHSLADGINSESRPQP